MLSICIFEILNTATSRNCQHAPRLWIALDLYLWNIEHSKWNGLNRIHHVVNCSRFVSLKYWTQQTSIWSRVSNCCELLSICIFEILNTAIKISRAKKELLWIALDLYLWNIEHSFIADIQQWAAVVNCSRFVSLKYWTQPFRKRLICLVGCELLSICIFEILNTARTFNFWIIRLLWIALDLYLWNIEHSF